MSDRFIVRKGRGSLGVSGDGMIVVDQYEWLLLNVGRFLAAPSTIDGGCEYLLLGTKETTEQDEVGLRIRQELEAFQSAFLEVHRRVRREPAVSDVAKNVLLALRLPRSPDEVHLRGGDLQLSGWGLSDGVAIFEDTEDRLIEYAKLLEGALGARYAQVAPSNRDGLAWGGDFRPELPEAPAQHRPGDAYAFPQETVRSEDSSSRWVERGVAAAAILLVMTLYVIERVSGPKVQPAPTTVSQARTRPQLPAAKVDELEWGMTLKGAHRRPLALLPLQKHRNGLRFYLAASPTRTNSRDLEAAFQQQELSDLGEHVLSFYEDLANPQD